MKIKDFINGKVTYDKFGGQYFWITDQTGGIQMLAELRGWGHIQHMFPYTKEGQEEAAKYQDEVGEWIATAINEKLERDAITVANSACLHEWDEGHHNVHKCKKCGKYNC